MIFLVLQAFGNVAAHDALRQTFHDGGLSDARFADQHRIVLGAPGQNLNDAADLVVAADHRIELVLRGHAGQVATVFFQSFVGGLGVLGGDTLASAHLLQRQHKAIAAETEVMEELAGVSPLLGYRQQHVLHRNVVILEVLGLVFGFAEQLLQSRSDVHLIGCGRRTGDLRKTIDLLLQTAAKRLDVDVCFVEDRRHQPAFLLHQGEKQMLDVDLLVAVTDGERLRLADRLLHLLCETVEINCQSLVPHCQLTLVYNRHSRYARLWL
jgi:hypothetical protein